MNSNNRKLIPIIGTISAGKSTFLNGLLGTNILQRVHQRQQNLYV